MECACYFQQAVSVVVLVGVRFLRTPMRCLWCYLSFGLAGFGSSFVGSEGVIAASASAVVRVRTWMSFKPETVE